MSKIVPKDQFAYMDSLDDEASKEANEIHKLMLEETNRYPAKPSQKPGAP